MPDSRPASAVSVSFSSKRSSPIVPRREETLVDVAQLAAEGDEGPGADRPRDLTPEGRLGAALGQLALEQVGGADVVGVALDPRRLALALAAVPGHLARLGGPRRLLPLAQGRQQRPVHEQVGVAADRRGEVTVGGAAQSGVAAVAVAVGGLHQGAEHERCIRLAAMSAPRRLLDHQPARLGGDLPGLTRGQRPAAAAGSARRAPAAARPVARSAADRAGRGRGRRRAPACARAAGRPVRWRGSSGARSGGGTPSAQRSGLRPRRSSRRSGTRARWTRRRGWSRHGSRQEPRPHRGPPPAARRRPRARSHGQRRSGRAGRSRAGRGSGYGCGRSRRCAGRRQG